MWSTRACFVYVSMLDQLQSLDKLSARDKIFLDDQPCQFGARVLLWINHGTKLSARDKIFLDDQPCQFGARVLLWINHVVILYIICSCKSFRSSICTSYYLSAINKCLRVANAIEQNPWQANTHLFMRLPVLHGCQRLIIVFNDLATGPAHSVPNESVSHICTTKFTHVNP